MCYICVNCLKPQEPKVALLRFTTQSRDQVYTNKGFDQEGEPMTITSTGKEIVTEIGVCPNCAGIEPKPERDLSTQRQLALTKADLAHRHAKTCKKPWGECKMCLANAEFFETLSPSLLSAVLN